MISLTPSTATRGSVTSILGKPLKVEENKKRTLWYYNHDNTDVVLSWSNKTASLLRVSFKNNPDKKGIFDNSIPSKLQSGKTDLAQALKILGIPHDVTIKEKTQEMHYNYQEKVLRLFFRDKVLVDYCLY
jgi:outer membrane protein assembly factor BamE (lipoprotein component of BamABCDE complex)